MRLKPPDPNVGPDIKFVLPGSRGRGGHAGSGSSVPGEGAIVWGGEACAININPMFTSSEHRSHPEILLIVLPVRTILSIIRRALYVP